MEPGWTSSSAPGFRRGEVEAKESLLHKDLPVDLLGCVCDFLYAHEHVLLGCASRLSHRLCSSPSTWHTLVYDVRHTPPGVLPPGLDQTSWTYVKRCAVITDQAVHGFHGLPATIEKLSVAANSNGGVAALQIDSLTGLAALRDLTLWSVSLTNLSPLAGLTALETLAVCAAMATDLSPLSGLVSLQRLRLVSIFTRGDLAPLANLTALQELYLMSPDLAHASSLSPLSNLKNLREINLDHTVPDLSALSGQLLQTPLSSEAVALLSVPRKSRHFLRENVGVGLQVLHLHYDQHVDLTPLAHFTGVLNLHCNVGCDDLSALSLLTALSVLDLSTTASAVPLDVSPLCGLTALRALFLDRAPNITGVASLSALTNLSLRQ